MKFTLEIELGNDAMQTKGDIAAALTQVAARFPRCIMGRMVVGDYGSIRDINGNTVGKWEIQK